MRNSGEMFSHVMRTGVCGHDSASHLIPVHQTGMTRQVTGLQHLFCARMESVFSVRGLASAERHRQTDARINPFQRVNCATPLCAFGSRENQHGTLQHTQCACDHCIRYHVHENHDMVAERGCYQRPSATQSPISDISDRQPWRGLQLWRSVRVCHSTSMPRSSAARKENHLSCFITSSNHIWPSWTTPTSQTWRRSRKIHP